MQQQVQTHLSAEQVLSEATSFFSKRRARISDRSNDGCSFSLQGSEESGRVGIAKASGAGSSAGPGCIVTVEAEGVTILAIAEGFVRELRKQSKSQPRSASGAAGNTGFGDLRQRLGMPEPPRAPRPQPQAPATQPMTTGTPTQADATQLQATPSPVQEPRPQVPEPPPSSVPDPQPSLVSTPRPPSTLSPLPPPPPPSSSPVRLPRPGPVPPPPPGSMMALPPGPVPPPPLGGQGTVRPDGPEPTEAASVSPTAGPKGAPAPGAAVEGAHASFTGPQESDQTSSATASPANEGSNTPPSAEALGGVPTEREVREQPDRPVQT